MPLPRRRAARWGLIAYLVVLGLVALWPAPVDQAGGGLLLAALRKLHRGGLPGWVDYGFVESASNVLLFVPLGALMVWLMGRGYWWVGPASVVLLSCLIELAQFLFLPARYPSPDVAANTLGAGLGAGLALLITTRRKTERIPPPARTL